MTVEEVNFTAMYFRVPPENKVHIHIFFTVEIKKLSFHELLIRFQPAYLTEENIQMGRSS